MSAQAAVASGAQYLREVLAGAMVRLMRPLVRILLRNGYSFQAAAELLKWTYMDVAYREFGIPGRKQSKSRVAVITGLTRIEVDRLKQAPPPYEQAPHERYQRAARVLSGWAEDSAFHDADGHPAVLPLDGGKASFSELVRRFSGGAPERAVLDELLCSGAVERVDKHHVRQLKSYFVPTAAEGTADKLPILGVAAGDLLGTLDRNIYRSHEVEPFFQRVVQSRHIPLDWLPTVRQELRAQGQAFADSADRLLYAHAQSESAGERIGSRRAGVGIYYFESDAGEE